MMRTKISIPRSNWKQSVLRNLGFLPLLALVGTAAAAEKAVVNGPVPAEQSVAFNIYLPLRDRDGLEALPDQLHSPNSPLYPDTGYSHPSSTRSSDRKLKL